MDRLFSGFYYYLFAPVQLDTAWPFIKMFTINIKYIGTTIYESVIGGYFSLNFISMFALTMFNKKYSQNNKMLYYFGIASIVFALIIITADTEMAGILTRYHQDFSWLLSLFCIISLMFVLSDYASDNLKCWILVLVAISVFMNILTYFVWNGIVDNPGMYDLVSKLFAYLQI